MINVLYACLILKVLLDINELCCEGKDMTQVLIGCDNSVLSYNKWIPWNLFALSRPRNTFGYFSNN